MLVEGMDRGKLLDETKKYEMVFEDRFEYHVYVNEEVRVNVATTLLAAKDFLEESSRCYLSSHRELSNLSLLTVIG